MNLCIPVENNNGLSSAVCAHFGSAPAYLIVDTDSRACRCVPNKNDHHSHGKCMPVDILQGESVDGIVVSGIGMGALNRLAQVNIQVYASGCATVGEAIDAYTAGALKPMEPGMTCRGHSCHE